MKSVLSVFAALLLLNAITGCTSCSKSDGERPLSPDDSASLVYDVPDSLIDFFPSNPGVIPSYDGYDLVWHEEFSRAGRLDSIWSYEQGFVRNEELQWYQADNTTLHDGVMDIEGRVERVINPNYQADHPDWRKNRPTAEYTSSCVTTMRQKTFKYGRFEVRAKIPVVSGAWPAIWLLGNQWGWPECGEIDVMEYYIKYGGPGVLANACWGTDKPHHAEWDEGFIPFAHFTEKDPLWADKYHVWRLDWDAEVLNIYLDDELLNTIETSKTVNGGVKENTENPFSNDVEDFADYLLFDLAIGGNGGTPADSLYPIHYLVDYVRVYQPLPETK